jgi:hypothetical protein
MLVLHLVYSATAAYCMDAMQQCARAVWTAQAGNYTVHSATSASSTAAAHTGSLSDVAAWFVPAAKHWLEDNCITQSV